MLIGKYSLADFLMSSANGFRALEFLIKLFLNMNIQILQELITVKKLWIYFLNIHLEPKN